MDPRIHQLHQPLPVTHTKKASQQSNVSFKEALNEASSLQISKHAKKRMSERDITINDSQWRQITNKVNEAKSKGVTDSLVVLKDSALVVSNKNNTVITALNKEESNDHIFTNINGTIILDQ